MRCEAKVLMLNEPKIAEYLQIENLKETLCGNLLALAEFAREENDQR